MQRLVRSYLPELEVLKQRIMLDHFSAPPATARHAPGAVQLTTSNLPEISNWGVPAAPSAPPLPPGEAGYGPAPPTGTPDYGGAAVGTGATMDWDLLTGPELARPPSGGAPAPRPAASGAAPVDDLLSRLQVSACMHSNRSGCHYGKSW